MTKPLAKSLHTVSVLVRVAKYGSGEDWQLYPEAALQRAVEILGYEDAGDPYGLTGAALRQLKGGAK